MGNKRLLVVFCILFAGAFCPALWYVSRCGKPGGASRPEETGAIKPESEEGQQAQAAEPSKTGQLLNDIRAANFAAERDFPKFLAGAWSRKTNYGFRAEDEQKDVSLAEPIFVYGIDEEIAGKLSREEELVGAVEPVGEWIYPVQVEREYRTLFGVRLRNNEWRGTYLGNPYLAESLQGIREAWTSEKGDEFKLVSCVWPRSFFFISLCSDRPNLTPVTRVELGEGQYLIPPAEWDSVSPAGPVLESLRRFWRANAVDGTPPDGVGQVDNNTR
jgi:hypothetical protein